MLTCAEILGPEGRIAKRLADYEHRPEQLRMAEAVADAIDAPHHLVVEAGTGVGKSFAYLVPAILGTARKVQKPGKEKAARRSPSRPRGHRHAHDQPSGTVDRQGHPVSQKHHPAGVQRRAGQGPAELPLPAAADDRPGAGRQPVLQQRRVRPAPADRPLGEGNPRRLAFGPRPQAAPAGLGRSGQRPGHVPGPQLPPQRGLLLLSGATPRVQRPDSGGQPRLVLQRPGLAARGRQAAARPRRRRLRRGPQRRERGRRAPGHERHQRPGRLRPRAAVQRPDEPRAGGASQARRRPEAGRRMPPSVRAVLRRRRRLAHEAGRRQRPRPPSRRSWRIR